MKTREFPTAEGSGLGVSSIVYLLGLSSRLWRFLPVTLIFSLYI